MIKIITFKFLILTLGKKQNYEGYLSPFKDFRLRFEYMLTENSKNKERMNTRDTRRSHRMILSEMADPADAISISKPREMTKEVNQDQTRLVEGKEMNQNPLTQVADYEQELYDKDRYIIGLENEIRGLMGLTYWEKIL